MSTVVIMPGGFHPFHAGHASLYQAALKAFPGADVYVAATNDTKTRPFPFAIKEKLAKLAGVADKRFVQVKSPFQPIEITGHYNPEEDVVIFVRSEKDRNESPKPGGTKKDGSPAYFQPWTGKNLQPFSKHAYIAYLPTVEFGPGISSASEIRNAWPTLNDKRKTAMVMSLYPATQKNPKLAANVVKMLDMSMGNELDEDMSRRGFLKGLGATAVAGASGNAMAQFANMHKDDPLVQHNKDIDDLAKAIYATMVAQRGEPMDRSQQRMWMTIAREKATIKLSQHAPGRPQPQSSSGFPKQGSERRVSKDINNFESKKLNEFVPPSSGGGGGENDRSRRIRKLLEIAIQVAKQKNVDELGMIHAMNMIAGDDFFSVAVEGILPDITDKEYMFVLQSAYKTVKQGLAEAEKTARVFHPQYVDVYFLDGPRRTPILVNKKVPYNLIDRYLEVAIKKYNLQQGRFEFRNAEEDVAEGWKTKLGAAALTGAMALGSSGAHSADISSPTFNGMQTISHNDGSNTTKYNSGPLSMQLTKNKQGKTTSAQRNYQIGDTNVGVGTNAIGVNTLTATGDKADNLVGVGPSAERLKVSPDKIKAFQQGVKESSFKKSNVSKNQDYLEEK